MTLVGIDRFCDFTQSLNATSLKTDSGSCYIICVVQLTTLRIVKISSRKRMKNAHHGRGCVWKIFDSSVPWNKLKPHLLCRSCEWRLNNFRVLEFRTLITESKSHFKRTERVKDLFKVSLRHRRPKLCTCLSLLIVSKRLLTFNCFTYVSKGHFMPCY